MQLLRDARPHLMTVAEYMSSDINDRTELVGGIVYDVSPRNEPHRYAVRILTEFLVKGLGPAYAVQGQDAVAVSGWHGKDAPEVDVAIIARKYYDPMATAADAFAFIEVSDSTYRDDRRVKIPLYVNAGVPAWIVNIPARIVECYADVADLELEHGKVANERDSFDVLGVVIPVAALFTPES